MSGPFFFPHVKILVHFSPFPPARLSGALSELLPLVSSAPHSWAVSSAFWHPDSSAVSWAQESHWAWEITGGRIHGKKIFGRTFREIQSVPACKKTSVLKTNRILEKGTLQGWSTHRNAPGCWEWNETHWRRPAPSEPGQTDVSHVCSNTGEALPSAITEAGVGLQHTHTFPSCWAGLFMSGHFWQSSYFTTYIFIHVRSSVPSTAISVVPMKNYFSIAPAA